MGRNKKLTKAVRERMARTGENYTTARTGLLAEPPRRASFRVRTTEDVEPGTGAVAEVWRTLHVRYVIRGDGRVMDETGDRPKVFALPPEHEGWMQALTGLRAGGLRRIEGTFARWGPVSVEARLVAVAPWVPTVSAQRVSTDRPAARGDRVRVRAATYLTDPARTELSEEAGLSFVVGDGGVEAGIDQLVRGMGIGGFRTALLPPDGDLPARWLWIERIDLG